MTDPTELYPYTTLNDPQISRVRLIRVDGELNNLCITLGASLFSVFIIYKKIPMNHISASISNRLKHYLENLDLEPSLLANITALIKYFDDCPSASHALKGLISAVFGDYGRIIRLFIAGVLEKEFSNAKDLLNTYFDHKAFEKIFDIFANCFLVNIQLVNNNDTKLTWCPNKVGSYPVITIAFDKITLYWTFSDYLLNVESGVEKLQENIIINQPFVMHVSSKHANIDKLFLQEDIPNMPSLEITAKGIMSKRTHISKLPLTIETILELQLEYCHCYAVKNRYNQINSFAIALYFTLKRPSLKDFKKKLIEKFQNQQTFTILTLPQSKDFRDQKFVRFLKLVKEIMMYAWDNTSQIDGLTDYPNGSLGELVKDLAVDTSVIRILSVIFGVTSVVLCEDHKQPGKFERVIYNTSENIIPSLHFIALSKNGLYQTYVLITNKHQYEIAYDLATEKTKMAREIKIKDIKNEIQIKQEAQVVGNDSVIDFLHETCKTQSTVLNSIKDQIIKHQLIKIDEESLFNDVRKLKYLREKTGEEEKFRETLSALEVPKFFRQGCHYCGEADNLISMNSQGCVFHKNCIAYIFNLWLANQYSFAAKIKNQSFLCPLGSEPIKLSYYLENIADEAMVIYCNEKFNKKFICAICMRKNPMSALYSHAEACRLRYCTTCITIFCINNPNLTCATCNLQIYIGEFTCDFCFFKTSIQNFLPVVNEKNQICCKKCWILVMKNSIFFTRDINILNSAIPLLNAEAVQCPCCEILEYANYSNFLCSAGCNLCFECSKPKIDMACKSCGANVIEQTLYIKDY